MKFTLSWLKKFLQTNASFEEILVALTDVGLEVEEVIDKSKELSAFKVAEILETSPHPNATKLQICKVQTAAGIIDVVCGAPNARAGIKVIFASEGTLIPNGNFVIKKSEIRGVTSNGMLCSENELLISQSDSGIAELPYDALIGEEISKYFGLDDPIIELSITPNRGDCLGVYGIARDLAAKGLGKLTDVIIPNIDHKITGSCSRKGEIFATLEISNLTNKESPEWLKKLLKSIGKEPISAIVDVTNYICYSFARPMHAYDKDKIYGKLKVSFAKTCESFKALNDKIYLLGETDLVVSDDNGPTAIAGVIGGMDSSVTKSSKSIILEAAVFDAILVAKSGRKHHIDTDSRHRFERNIDHAFTLDGLKIAAQMIKDICGGELSNISVIANPDEMNFKRTISFDVNILEFKTGLKLENEKIIEILTNLGFKVVEKSTDLLDVTIPPWRSDVSIKEDIIEEIVRIYGYDKIEATPLPNLYLSRVLSQIQRRSFDSKRIMASLGYDELVTWSFMSDNKAKYFYDLDQSLMLKNPISQDLNYMRGSIIPNLLDILSMNIARSFNNLAFFEVGPIFMQEASEKLSIGAVRMCKLEDKTPHQSRNSLDVFDLKADIEILMKELGLPLNKCSINAEGPKYYHPKRVASITLGKNIIGYFGQIHPTILELHDIKDSVLAFEIDMNSLPETKLKYGNKGKYTYSIYQSLQRDFAFLVDKNVKAGDMINYLQKIDNKLIKQISLFDLYEGDKIDASKKSLAFNITIQADDRTLTDNEINNLSNNIITGVNKQFGAVIRGA